MTLSGSVLVSYGQSSHSGVSGGTARFSSASWNWASTSSAVAASGPDGLPDPADRAPVAAVLVGEFLPGGDDPGRVGAEVGHVRPHHPVGVAAEGVAQGVQPRLGHRDHHRLVPGQAVGMNGTIAVQELGVPAVQPAFVPVRPVRPGGPAGQRGDRRRRARGARARPVRPGGAAGRPDDRHR